MGTRVPKLGVAVTGLWVCAALLGLAGAVQGAEVVEYVHLDAIGNVRAVTNGSGEVVERHDYLPYGEECVTGSCAGNAALGSGQPKRFTGKERDTETGLDYFGARYYGSKIGRFTTVDPVVEVKGALANPQLWNRYAYGRNSPLRYVDPDGRLSFEIDPHSRNSVSAADVQRAKDAQTALRKSLTPQVKAYFQNQFGKNLEALLADDSGPVVQLSSGTLTGQVGQCKNGPGCQIRLNLDYGTGDIQAGMIHELGHHLERAGGRTYPNVVFDQKLKAETERAANLGGAYRFGAPNLLKPSERASYYAEMYQFNGQVRTFWAIPEN